MDSNKDQKLNNNYDSVNRENNVFSIEINESGKEKLSCDKCFGTFLLIIGGLVLFLGGGFLFSTSSGFDSDRYVYDNYTPSSPPSLKESSQKENKLTWDQKWLKEGKKVYSNCIACHMASGEGVPGQFPPLVGSDWISKGNKRLGAILLHGISGPFTVKGQVYNQLMPPWKALNDKKLAQVASYVRYTFGGLSDIESWFVSKEAMQKVREEFSSQPKPFTEHELLSIPKDKNIDSIQIDFKTGKILK